MKTRQMWKLLCYVILTSMIIFASFVGCDLEGTDEPDSDVRVIFYTDEILTVRTVSRGAPVTAPAAPTKAGHTFGGWYTDTGFTDPWNFASDTVTEDLVLYAKWTPQTYTITFVKNNGQSDHTVTVAYGAYIPKPTKPENGTKMFCGWFMEPEFVHKWKFETQTITGPLTLYAGWDLRFSSHLTEYRAATLDDVTVTEPDVFTFDEETDDIDGFIVQTILSSMEQTALVLDAVMDDPTVTPLDRSINALFRLNIANEGVSVVNGDDSVDLYVDHLDLEIAAGVSEFTKSIINFITEMNRLEEVFMVDPYAEDEFDFGVFADILLTGRLGLSTFIEMQNSLPHDMASGLYVDFSVDDLDISGTVPTGLVNAEFNFSVATNLISDGTTIYHVPATIELWMQPMMNIPLEEIIVDIMNFEGDYIEFCEQVWGVTDAEGTAEFCTLSVTTDNGTDEGNIDVTLMDEEVFAFFDGLFMR